MKNSHLLLAIDLGASGSKIVGSIAGQPDCKAILMTPHCVDVDSTLDRDPLFNQHNVWVKIGSETYAVGNLAKIKYNATNKLRPAKFTTAVPKICAAIAVFAQAFNLSAKFDLSISFVLPPAEWEQASIVIERLQAALKDIETPNGKIKPRLLSITPYPEGMGILLGQNLVLTNIVGPVTVIMLGFRNASVLSSTKGVVSRPNTNDLGFHDLLMSIASKTGYKVEDIIEPVFEYEKQKKETEYCIQRLVYLEKKIKEWDSMPWSQKEHLQTIKPDPQDLPKYKKDIADSKQKAPLTLNPILRCTGTDRQTELDSLIKSIDSANKEYWMKLTDWLGEKMPSQSSYICLSGGTANYFKKELELYVKDKVTYPDSEHGIRWHSKVDPYKESGVYSSGDRFNDIYVLWTELKKQYQPVIIGVK
jgi:hypothetical protein